MRGADDPNHNNYDHDDVISSVSQSKNLYQVFESRRNI